MKPESRRRWWSWLLLFRRPRPQCSCGALLCACGQCYTSTKCASCRRRELRVAR